MLICQGFLHSGVCTSQDSRPTGELLLVGGWLAGQRGCESVVAHRGHQRAQRGQGRDALHAGNTLRVTPLVNGES